MKNVKCINPKNFNLTEGKEYEANDEIRRNYYQVRNDNGVLVNYYSNLFKDAVIEVEVAPEPVRSTVNQILDTVAFDLARNGNEVVITVNYTIDEENKNFQVSLGCYSAQISCGVHELTNLNGICHAVTEGVIRRTDAGVNLRKELFKKTLQYAIENSINTGIVMVSTNISNNGDLTPYKEVLDDLSNTNLETRNPNSGNNIGVWSFIQGHQEEEEE